MKLAAIIETLKDRIYDWLGLSATGDFLVTLLFMWLIGLGREY